MLKYVSIRQQLTKNSIINSIFFLLKRKTKQINLFIKLPSAYHRGTYFLCVHASHQLNVIHETTTNWFIFKVLLG